MVDFNFSLSEKVVKQYCTYGKMIEGSVYADSKQEGKSSYVLQNMFDVYDVLYDSIYSDFLFRDYEGEDRVSDVWGKTFDRFYLDVEELLKDLDFVWRQMRFGDRGSETKIPIACLDDAGVGASGKLWFEDRDKYNALDKVVQTIGKVCNCLIVTSPGPDKPASKLVEDRNLTIKVREIGKSRDIEDWVVYLDQEPSIDELSDLGIGKMEAKIFFSDKLPWGSKKDYNVLEDEFWKWLPEEIYNKYSKVRLDLTGSSLDSAFENAGIERKGKVGLED